jgi:hypothetical protein
LQQYNGIYKVDSSSLVRDYDLNIDEDAYAGIEVLVLSGLTYSGKTFYQTNSSPITIGVTPMVFSILAGQNGSSGTSGTSGTRGLSGANLIFTI